MDSPRREDNLIYGVKLSSVGPGKATGSDVIFELSNMDLAMKLHYIRGVYFFSSQAVEGLTVKKIKETMFTWFDDYYYTCGRCRRSESGRPFIKCNDCGARFIEAQCDKTIDEWLEMRDWSAQKLLVSQQVIGPDLFFSPPVLLQITWFKCGGFSLGLSWPHILGDAISASGFINRWGHVVSDLNLTNLPKLSEPHPIMKKSTHPLPSTKDPVSLKRVDPVGDHWITLNNCKMETFSIHLNSTQLTTIQSEMSTQSEIDQIPLFESICAIIWQSIAKIRIGYEPKTVTVCKNDPNKRMKGVLSNKSQIIKTVNADSSITVWNSRDLAMLIVNQGMDEREEIEKAVERENGVADFVMYGANLTFVDLEEGDLYGFELNKKRPEFVYYSIQGVGDEGAVLVLPDGGEGRLVTLILPEDQILELKSEFKSKGFVA